MCTAIPIMCAFGNNVATGQICVKKNVELRPLRDKSIVFFSITAICPQVGYITLNGFIFVLILPWLWSDSDKLRLRFPCLLITPRIP